MNELVTYNTWGIKPSDIVMMGRILQTNNNVSSFTQSDGVVFDVDRIQQNDQVRIVLLSEYVLGMSSVLRAMEEISEIDMICTGGRWNKPAGEAIQLCADNDICICGFTSINQFLREDDFHGLVGQYS